jgi:hypothetical protein
LVADIILFVLACLGTPFTLALLIKCTLNIISDSMSIGFLAKGLDSQIKENDRLRKLIKLLTDYENNCAVNFQLINTYYNTIKTKLAAYKDSVDPTARVNNSTIVVNTSTLLIDLISENC